MQRYLYQKITVRIGDKITLKSGTLVIGRENINGYDSLYILEPA